MVDIEVDLNLLARRLAPLGAVDLRPLPGGASSLSYVATAGGRRVVVKVAPAGLAPVRNRDVLRQARMLRSLAATDVPVPEVLLQDPGNPPAVPPLFAMSFVEGTSIEPLFDADGDDGNDEAPVVADRMRDAAGVLAALHRVDPAAIGLAREPATPLAGEVERWSIALRTVDDVLVPRWPDVARALLDAAPAPMVPAVLHGDFRLGNVLAVGPTVTAVIDWEIWSVGDPRVDLGWYLVNADPGTYRRSTPYVGLLPEPTELADAYADHLGREVLDVAWFRALACFKSTATWALIVKHARGRARADATTEAVAGHLPVLLEQAAALLRY